MGIKATVTTKQQANQDPNAKVAKTVKTSKKIDQDKCGHCGSKLKEYSRSGEGRLFCNDAHMELYYNS